MESYVEKAVNLHKNGYNCAQSIVCAFAQELGADYETAFRLSEGFGGGIGVGGCKGLHCGKMLRDESLLVGILSVLFSRRSPLHL